MLIVIELFNFDVNDYDVKKIIKLGGSFKRSSCN